MYQALYRKWRPAVFSDVAGQEHITSTLKNEVNSNKIGHAYLFTGTRGTGKTTCAKILSKAVNCLNLRNGDPCNECEICRGINEGSIYDVIEIDAASNNGVDNIRELRDEAIYAPSRCRKKVYIIDEVHMLSPGAFNALLKTLEEPPAHVVFILATTEVHKIPATILSRCQRFDFKRISANDIFTRISYIAEKEGINIDKEAAMLISRLADGALRDALSILEQCSGTGDRITLKSVNETVGIADTEHIFKISDAVRNGDCAAVLNIMSELYQSSKKMDELISELIKHFRDIMVAKASQNNSVLDKSEEDKERIAKLAEKYTLSEILYCINTLNESLSRMSRVSDNRTEAEVCLIKLCNPKLDNSTEALSARISRLEAMINSGNIITNVFKNEDTKEIHEAKSDLPIEKVETSAEPKPVSFWAEVLQEVRQQGKAQLNGFLKNSTAYETSNGLEITVSNSVAFELLNKNENIRILEDAISVVSGKKYNIKYKLVQKKEKDDLNFNDKLSDLF